MHQLTVPVTKAGRYRVAMQYRMGGWHDGDGSYALQLALGEKALAKEIVETGGEKFYTLKGDVELPAGDVVLNYTTTPAGTNESARSRPLELRPGLWLIGPLDSDLEYPESHRRVLPGQVCQRIRRNVRRMRARSCSGSPVRRFAARWTRRCSPD
jgi:hypothetical protein